MKIIKCPSCGADLKIEDDMKIAYCMYCGAKLASSNSDNEIKAIEMASKIDLLLKDKENRQISQDDIDMACDIAKTIIKLYPSNYLGFFKMAQACMCIRQPLLVDLGTEQNYNCTKNYFDIAENVKQARILASANQMPEVDAIDIHFKQRIAYEEKKDRYEARLCHGTYAYTC